MLGVVDRPAPRDEGAVSFGPFRLLIDRRLLLEGEKPVRLGSRALDILVALVEQPGEVVAKDELIARVWPNTTVEESNVKFQISALRRTLGGGNRYVLNVPGRGYSFIAPVTRAEEPKSAAQQATAAKDRHNLPAHLTRLIGRADTVSRLERRLMSQRLLTIVGPGGIGKTSVALAVAEALIPSYEHGVWLIDLAPVGDPRLVPTALADALGLEIHSEDPLPRVLEVLRDRRSLLVELATVISQHSEGPSDHQDQCAPKPTVSHHPLLPAHTISAACGAGIALIVCYWLCRLVLDRRRLAAWESAWALTGPRWTTRR